MRDASGGHKCVSDPNWLNLFFIFFEKRKEKPCPETSKLAAVVFRRDIRPAVILCVFAVRNSRCSFNVKTTIEKLRGLSKIIVHVAYNTVLSILYRLRNSRNRRVHEKTEKTVRDCGANDKHVCTVIIVIVGSRGSVNRTFFPAGFCGRCATKICYDGRR